MHFLEFCRIVFSFSLCLSKETFHLGGFHKLSPRGGAPNIGIGRDSMTPLLDEVWILRPPLSEGVDSMIPYQRGSGFYDPPLISEGGWILRPPPTY